MFPIWTPNFFEVSIFTGASATYDVLLSSIHWTCHFPSATQSEGCMTQLDFSLKVWNKKLQMLHEVVKFALQKISLPASCLMNYDFHYLSGYMLGCSWASSATCDSLFTPNVLAELRGTVDGVVEKLEVHCSVAWWSFHMIGNTLVIKLTEEVPPPVPAGPKFHSLSYPLIIRA